MSGVAQYEFRFTVNDRWGLPAHYGNHPLGPCNEDDYFTVMAPTEVRAVEWVNNNPGPDAWFGYYDMSDGEEYAEFRQCVHGDNIATIDLITHTIWRRDTGEKVDLP